MADLIRTATADVIEGPAGFSVTVSTPLSSGVSLIALAGAVLDKYLTHRAALPRYVSNIKLDGVGPASSRSVRNPAQPNERGDAQ